MIIKIQNNFSVLYTKRFLYHDIGTVPVAGNTIVTYYGFTILDLVRLQEGEQYREESL